MKGWVYIITTKSMPDLVKVGFSTKDPDLRAAELNNTGNPHPYKVEYEVLVNEPRNVEQIAHRLLKNKDLHENKEWFNCSIELAVIAIRKAADGGIFLENIRAKIFSESEIEITSVVPQELPESIEDAWLDELIAWADENYIFKEQLPREKHEILSMTLLNLSSNRITKLPESIGKLTNLTVLYLWDSPLTGLPESIGKLTNLTELSLLDSSLVELPKSIGKLTNLTLLDLRSNRITELPESIGKLTNLTDLYLDGNQLTELPESIGKLTNLTLLDLSSNRITELPEFIGKLTKLTELYLGGNQLTELPESVGKLTNLTELDLIDNSIKSLPPELSHLSIAKFNKLK